MIYFIHGTQKPMIDKQVSTLVKEVLSEPNDFSLVTFDCEETAVQNVVADAITLPLGEEQKVIVAKNAYFFASKFNKEMKIIQEFDVLRHYLEAAPTFSTLIFTLAESKIDGKNEWVKLLRKYGKVISLVDIDKREWPTVVKRLFANRGVMIEESALQCFLDRVGRDLIDVVQEVDKLATYSKKIQLQDVEQLVARPLEDNVFGIADALLSKETNMALQIFRDLRLNNEEPLKLLPIIANQLRFFYQVGYLYQQEHLREAEIVSQLKVHPYRVSLALRRFHSISLDRVLALLYRIGRLDYQIKSGQVDRIQSFELFLIEAGTTVKRSDQR